MKKFKFKLETVLQVKVRREEICKKELYQAEQNCAQARSELERCQHDVVETEQICREQLTQNFNLHLANQYNKYLSWLNKQVEMAEQRLAQMERLVESARCDLLEATKEKKILEKLKEKAYQEYLAEEARAETIFLDELGTGRFMRDKMAEQEVHSE